MIPTIIKKQIIIFFKLFFIIISPLYCATMKESHPIRWNVGAAKMRLSIFCVAIIFPSDRMGFFLGRLLCHQNRITILWKETPVFLLLSDDQRYPPVFPVQGFFITRVPTSLANPISWVTTAIVIP